MGRLVTVFLLVSSLLGMNPLRADPWFTGPLLAPAGHNIPRGHTNIEIYGLNIDTNGRYDRGRHIVRTPEFDSRIFNPIITHGFTDWLDVQFNIPYIFNSTRHVNYNRLADVAMALGFQLFEQKGASNRMDIRFLLQETFPTGRFERLNDGAFGTDSTGLGSYLTSFGLNFQYLKPLYNNHYLRTRLILSRLYASPVNVFGLNSYGGTISTQGKIRPGSENGLDLAFEYTLTQHWVAVMEGTWASGAATRFNGVLNIGNIGGPGATIGSDQYGGETLAPALEYNFNGNVGLIGGVWFPWSGKNTSRFMTFVLALNAYW